MPQRLRRLLIAHGALVYLAGLLAGFPFAFVELGKIALWPLPGEMSVAIPGDVRGWRMAHLEGILNGLTLIGVAAIGAELRLGARAYGIIAWALIVTAWGNTIASVLGPLTGGRGLEFGEGAGNRAMYILFVVAVGTVMAAMWLVYRGARAGDDESSGA
jgi:hypothetical protein